MAAISTAKTVLALGDSLKIPVVLTFDSVDIALANFDNVKRAYPRAERYRVLQNYILVIKTPPESSLAELKGL